jgi:heat shock transcription factor
VIDEDEFARKLIPELFKHNNYASFVRQLNMYGFHKKVGLSDNSMKASENKRKTPSEYYNKFFKRGRPELLWLIQKPKNPPTTKRKRDDKSQGDSDDEQPAPPAPVPTHANVGPAGGNTDLAVLPRTELQRLRQELNGLQQNQKVITQVIQQMRQQNDNFYRQATAFQEMHQRHENSINAILTFLATFYNRSLEGQGNINELFNPSLPQSGVQPGNIVDIGDIPEEIQMPMRRAKQQLLLPAPEARSRVATPNSPATVQTARSTVSPRPRNASMFRNSASTTPIAPPAAPSPPVKNEIDSPGMVDNNQDMLSVLNAANSASPKTAPGLDFDSALHHFQNADGNTPLTQQQRNDMLSLMQASMGGMGGGKNNALSNPQTPPMPSLSDISAQNEQLDYLQRLTQQQNAGVENLRGRIHSLSPSGYFAGLDHPPNPPPDFNLDDWMLPPPEGDFGNINFDDFGNATGGNGDLGASGTGIDGLNQDHGNAGLDETPEFDGHGFLSPEQANSNYQGGKVESISSRATTASPREKVQGEVDSPRKRRRAQ